MDETVKVRIENMAKIYDNGDGVRNINLDIQKGEIITLLGPSGCGKTTVLRALGGFNDLTEGAIYIDGEDVTALPPESRPTSMVFQGYNLWPHMTVRENLAFGLKLRKIPQATIDKEIKEMLALVSIPGMEDKYPGQLSGGQQQRVAIARSLLLKPSVLLMDEPFSALDAKIRMQMREELKRIQSTLNITVVFVTHDQEEAMSLSHRIVVMDKGSIAQVGTPTEIYDNPANKYVASFIGEMNFIDNNHNELAFRPEDILLDFTGEGLYEGVIQTVMLLGHYATLTIATDKGDIKAFVQREVTSQLKEGQHIRFNISKTYTYTKEGEEMHV